MRAADSSNRYKVVIVGPSEAGKSVIANVIAEAAEAASEAYRPTAGVRILECESEVRSGSARVTVELWDVSGDTKYQKCWPAIKKDAVGAILVYNPEKQNHEQEIEQWFQWFPRTMNMSPNQVMVIQSLRRADVPRRMPLPAKLAAAGVAQPAAVPADDLVSARKFFSSFLETVRQSVMDKQRQEEEDVMKGG
mmetsp:Transcript_2229/g.4092  ORF Transcript_2229/g.4092 Transcript_2229/m.4092 type:complete len:193 (-) Transcript_2229:137-715(-)|eukprot:CAMPEP_0197653354 /NCGR_PEP_ID=MMETSP1338-20131121/35210_1 /TAXON_ID=43686 ORGANISM="Pelagodinium beii, Strain RCC1491" /NCGR_SAMPLE_ID=MMETSP1338 /ASSEMBLY_ACC=CAM_ASM_000754 /LENGTH=192 /DNA_ID=CAMNT_0043228433 /DNA_START=66 /DNA_END=644 /DNA_ORIENTATION=+